MPSHYYNTSAPNRFMSDPMYQSNRQPPQRVDLENAILQGGVQQTSAAPNKLAALMNYIKNLDPGSVVREGEFDASTLLHALDPSSVVRESELGALAAPFASATGEGFGPHSAEREGEINYETYKFPDRASRNKAISDLMTYYKEDNPETYFRMTDGSIRQLLDVIAKQTPAPTPEVQKGIDRIERYNRMKAADPNAIVREYE